MDYLSNLSIQHKHKKKRKNKTLKTQLSSQHNMVHISLPPELNTNYKQPTNINTTTNIPIISAQHLKEHNKSPPPYSCLKGSSKPTYREWKNLTQKNYIIM